VAAGSPLDHGEVLELLSQPVDPEGKTLQGRVCRMDLPRPTTSVGTRTDTRWAPGTTRLALHGN
jgi:hypothetical protein